LKILINRIGGININAKHIRVSAIEKMKEGLNSTFVEDKQI